MRRQCNGAKHCTEATDQFFRELVVGERSGGRRSSGGTHCGGNGSEDAGMSNEKGGESPPRRKPKVSWVKVVFPGLVGP